MKQETVIEATRSVSSTMELAELLRRLRIRQARRRRAPVVTYRALAARTGWSHGIVGAYLSGKVLPPVNRFDRLILELDASPAECGALATARDWLEDARRAQLAEAIPPRHLPAAIFPLIGRASTLTMLDEEWARGPAMILAAGAGMGKTALAVHWAHGVAGEFPDGQLHADLCGSAAGRGPRDPADVLAGLLHSLGIAPGRLPSDTNGRVQLYRSILAQRRVLVLLDDAKDAEQVRPLLPGNQNCRALITSRSPLTGVVAVEGARLIMVDPLTPQSSRGLLEARLGPRRITADQAAVDAIVGSCGGRPLALAMVAAHAAARPELALGDIARYSAAGAFPAPETWDRMTDVTT